MFHLLFSRLHRIIFLGFLAVSLSFITGMVRAQEILNGKEVMLVRGERVTELNRDTGDEAVVWTKDGI